MFWGITGIPCKHAIRSIIRERKDLEDFVDESYSIEKYELAYNVVIHPIRDPQLWQERDLPKLGPHQWKI